MTQAMDVVETTSTITSVLLKVTGWIFVVLGGLLGLVAVGAALVALDAGGSAAWFAEHSTECGPTGGASFDTCSDTGRNPEIGEVKAIFWFLTALFTGMAILFIGGGWLTIWVGGRTKRVFRSLSGAAEMDTDAATGSAEPGPPPPGPISNEPPPPGPISG